MERVASLFRDKHGRAVRIPNGFELPGNTVTIVQQADGSLVIRPRYRLNSLLRTLEPLDPDDALGEIPELEADDRSRLFD